LLPKEDERAEFVIVLAYGKVSVLELASLQDSRLFDFELLKVRDNVAQISATTLTALLLIKRLGGSYKIARIYSRSASDLVARVGLPYSDRFNWTVSCYNCEPDLPEQTKSEFLDLIKSKSIRKAKYLEPNLNQKSERDQDFSIQEMKVEDLDARILNPQDSTEPGLDLVVVGSLESEPLYGITVGCSDVAGYKKRDFGRSYQDPTKTLSPRISRILVNLSVTVETKMLLDPFCGLGTILQEALICGYSVVGVDKSQAFLQKASSNLSWLKDEYHLSPKLRVNLVKSDARELERRDIPSIDAIATEPILIPKFKENPTSAKSKEVLGGAIAVYRKSLSSMSAILAEKKGRMTIVTPSIVDDRGNSHSLMLPLHAYGSRLKLYNPNLSGVRFDYPLKIESSKKRIVNRNVYVFTA
jgi:tRNA G10  N-methylase Trm11